MKTVTISSKGQIAVPKEVREPLHIKEGDQLIYHIENGRIILEPVINVPRSQAHGFGRRRFRKRLKRPMRTLKKVITKRIK